MQGLNLDEFQIHGWVVNWLDSVKTQYYPTAFQHLRPRGSLLVALAARDRKTHVFSLDFILGSGDWGCVVAGECQTVSRRFSRHFC